MAEKKTGFILLDAGPGDHEGRNAEIAAVKAVIEAEEIAAGRAYDDKRFEARIEDDMICVNWTYR